MFHDRLPTNRLALAALPASSVLVFLTGTSSAASALRLGGFAVSSSDSSLSSDDSSDPEDSSEDPLSSLSAGSCSS